MPFGLPDASLVTEQLCQTLREALSPLPDAATVSVSVLSAAPTAVPVIVSGDPPDVLRQKGGAQVSVYLFHVMQNTSMRNAPVVSQTALPIPYQPLGLELFYLVTAFCEGDYAREQQLFSEAMKCLHENPALRITPPGREEPERLRVALEPESLSDMAQRAQAAGIPIRLSAVYRVGTLFLEPPAPPPAAPRVTAWTVSAYPFTAWQDKTAQVLGTVLHARYTKPGGAEGAYDLSPATVAPGQTFLLHGLNFGGAANRVCLLDAGGTERDVTDAWVQSGATTDSRFVLQIPVEDAPVPGVYQLCVGGAAGTRSNATPFQIAAAVSAQDGPLLTREAPQIQGQGFLPGFTEIYLNTLRLTETTGTAQKGQFRVMDAGLIRFRPPESLPPGRYAVRVRVNRVESPPALWLDVK